MSTADPTNLIQALMNPPAEARGWTRWWWFGCAVTKEEILRELLLMKAADIGGVELQILYPVVRDDAQKGIKNLPYFSPEFFEMVKYAADTSVQLGMGFDYTLGSAWPYGGPFVADDMAAQSVIPYQIDLHGPIHQYTFDFTARINGKLVRAILGQMENSRMVESSVQDVSDHIRATILYGWPWGQSIERIEVPEGNWKLVVFVQNNLHLQIRIPSREAGGQVMDHCRKDVTQFFLKNAAQPLLDRVGNDHVNCFFCDSIELDGMNWTPELPAEFARRRGYDLTPYLYALWGDVDGVSDRIRYDYYLTMSELTIGNFLEEITTWCHAHGVKSRIQAHGTWGDILKAYASADVPEGETFGPQDHFQMNSIQRRFASSAGHLYGRKIISNETFTWLRTPRFIENLEHMKASVDAVFLDGMNKIYNHGYAYSPKEAGRPGWSFYASSQINHTNPLWKFYPELGKYIQRVSALLQVGTFRNKVAFYLPQADVWSDNTLAALHLGLSLQQHLGWEYPDAINKAGYSFDYINDEMLNANVEDGKPLIIQGNEYSVLILMGCTRLPAETACSLQTFVANGGILLASEYAPYRSCGLLNYQEKDNIVRKTMEELFGEVGTWKVYGKGFAGIAPDRKDGFIRMLHEKANPDIEIEELTQVSQNLQSSQKSTDSQDSCTVGYLHRKYSSGDYYFLANISSKKKHCRIRFTDYGRYFRIIDPLSMKELPILNSLAEDRCCMEIEFQEYQSAFLFFQSACEEGWKDLRNLASYKEEHSQKISLRNVYWTFKIPGFNHKWIMPEPKCWQNLTDLQYYTGEGRYSMEVVLTGDDLQAIFAKKGRVYLCLTEVHDACYVEINGRNVGNIWKRPYEVEVTDDLQAGKNKIAIYCFNTLINSVLNPANEPEQYAGTVEEEWPYYTEVVNHFRRERLGYAKERRAIKKPLPAGIQGPVNLEMRY